MKKLKVVAFNKNLTKRKYVMVAIFIFSFSYSLSTNFALAQDCQITTSSSEINAGSQHFNNLNDDLFSERNFNVSASCKAEQSLSIQVDGESGDSGKSFYFGYNGKIMLELASAQCNGVDISLVIRPPGLDPVTYKKGSQANISPGTLLTLEKSSCSGAGSRLLELHMKLTFKRVKNFRAARDLEYLDGQLLFNLIDR